MARHVITSMNPDTGASIARQAPNSTNALEQAKADRKAGLIVTVHNWETGKCIFGRKHWPVIRAQRHA